VGEKGGQIFFCLLVPGKKASPAAVSPVPASLILSVPYAK
jgi:hypothetical protein